MLQSSWSLGIFSVSKQFCGALAVAALGVLGLASPVLAQAGRPDSPDYDLTLSPNPKMLATEGEKSWDDYRNQWRYRSYIGLWASGMDGTLGKGDFESDVDVSFTDLFDKMTLGLSLNFEAGKGPWSVIVWGQYSQFEGDITTRNGFDGDAEATFAFADIGLAYLFFDNPGQEGTRFTLEAVGGLRWTYLSTEIAINEGPFAGLDQDREKNWFDPYVGLRARYDFSRQFNVSVLGTIGGFGVGSDLAWTVNALAEYRFNETWSVFGGYRILDYDYEDDGFKFDVQLSGPVIGFCIRH